MDLYSQENRQIRISTVLGEDVLHVEALHGSEGISQLFSYELSLVSEARGICFEKLIGTSVTVSINLSSGNKRYLNGIISSFSQGSSGKSTGSDSRFSHYRATMVPWLWLLTRSAESRIYQNMSVPEIAEQLFKEHGCNDFQLKLQGSDQKREYCVQYRETHFNFISRLLEKEGIGYFFEQSAAKHKMILFDNPQASSPCPEQKSASFQILLSGQQDGDVITELESTKQIRASKFSLSDFNFRVPNTSLSIDVPGNSQLCPGEREIYDYPGDYEKKNEGEQYARIRMEEEESQVTTVTGASSCRAFSSGYRFTLKNFHKDELNDKEYILVALEHHITQVVQAGGHFAYGNRFVCLPAEMPFRPLRRSRKPVVNGVQTALVVGPIGEEIYVDEHGRVKVQFHWDRQGRRDEKSSCWIRVSQMWAGAGWGGMFIPRIGQEVIVDFLEGDPDRPIITGRVYNGASQPPYNLPEEKTKSTLKSNSSPGGGGFNEFRFEDRKGKEEIYLHGQKDWNVEILNDKGQVIGHDETLQVGNNRMTAVGVNQSVRIGANHSETVGANKTETVSINKAETIGMAKELSVGGLYQVTVGAAMNETVAGAKAEEVGLAKAVVVGATMTERVVGDRSLFVGQNLAATVTGDATVKAGRIVLEAENEIVFKAGSATISLKSSGEIVIKGASITENAAGEIVIKGAKTALN
jgi:type VI secretion system secreted protein VgrG